jgi:hypothetical protein
VQGKGVNLPPDGYLQGAQALCRRYGTLFCVDEIQTGFGRTGKLFAFEHWGLEPDLVPVAKSLSGGYVPVGALLMSRAVHEAVYDSMQNAVAHGSTFAPNELGMVAGLATLQELDDEHLVEHSARLGRKLLELTQPLVDEFDVVREVRGLGLMWAIEFGEPESRKLSWKMIEKMQPGLFAQLVVGPLFSQHRILSQVAGHKIAVLKVLPPLVVTDEDIEYFAESLASSIKRAQRTRRAVTRFALTAGGSPREKKPLPELAELGARRDAGGGPAVRRRDDPVGCLGGYLAAALGVDLDHDLVHRRLDVVAELVPRLRDHRERGNVGAQCVGEVVDLRRRRVAPGVHAEVHPNLEGGRGVRVDAECDFGLHGDIHLLLPTGGRGI